MIKVFIPQNKGRVKTDIRGFWYSSETKKTYYDYLKVIDYPYSDVIQGKQRINFNNYCRELKIKYNQESIFSIDINKQLTRIYYNRDKIEVLQHRIYTEVLKTNLRVEIKEALKNYGGVTIYKIGNKYFKEVFYK